MSRFRPRACLVDVDAELFVIMAMFRKQFPIAGGEWKSIPVEDVTLGNFTHDHLEAGIVLEALRTIRLYYKGAGTHHGVASNDLHISSLRHHQCGDADKHDNHSAHRQTER